MSSLWLLSLNPELFRMRYLFDRLGLVLVFLVDIRMCFVFTLLITSPKSLMDNSWLYHTKPYFYGSYHVTTLAYEKYTFILSDGHFVTSLFSESFSCILHKLLNSIMVGQD